MGAKIASLLDFREAYSSIAARPFQITAVHEQPRRAGFVTDTHGNVPGPSKISRLPSAFNLPKTDIVQVTQNKAPITFVTLLVKSL